jgi:4,5-dihydroxyphthalate decarboxylase
MTYIIARPEETFFRLFKFHEFDVSEMSFATNILGRTNVDLPYIALPIPLSRVFVHSGIFIRRDCGSKKPQDLNGKRVGSAQLSTNKGPLYTRHASG